MNQSNNTAKITKERVAGVVGVTMCLLGTSIGAATHDSYMGISLLTASVFGLATIFGYSMGFKAGRRTAFKEALV